MLDTIEKIIEQLVIDYPNLPPQYQGFAAEAFIEAVKHLNVKNIVLKCLIHTCSYPISTEVDHDLDVTSAKSFLRYAILDLAIAGIASIWTLRYSVSVTGNYGS